MSRSRGTAEHVVDLLGGAAGLRRFFGGWSVLYAGEQVAIVMDTVYAKVPPAERAARQAAGSRPFSYQARGRTVTVAAYWSVPAVALEDPAILRRHLVRTA